MALLSRSREQFLSRQQLVFLVGILAVIVAMVIGGEVGSWMDTSHLGLMPLREVRIWERNLQSKNGRLSDVRPVSSTGSAQSMCHSPCAQPHVLYMYHVRSAESCRMHSLDRVMSDAQS